MIASFTVVAAWHAFPGFSEVFMLSRTCIHSAPPLVSHSFLDERLLFVPVPDSLGIL